MCVRRPAAFSSSSRSRPITAPSAVATTSRASVPPQPSEKTSATSRIDAMLLLFPYSLDSDRRQLQELVELLAAERVALGRRLYLDQSAVAGHDPVQVDVGSRVLRVVEIEQRLAADDADRDRRHRVAERLAEPEAVERAPGGHVGAGDRGAARAAVGLQDVAVEPERALAE